MVWFERLVRMSIIAATVLFATSALAQEGRNVIVKFPRGASGTTVNERIKGYQTVNYRLGVTAGQRMSVQLDADNASAYFNITAPGASEALFNGSVSGNGASVIIPSSGNYVISVYLMRNAARRNEIANYALTLYVESDNAVAPRPKPTPLPQPVVPQNPSLDAVSTGQMPRFCAGEASAKYGVRPPEVATNMAFKSGNNYVVQGYFDGIDGTTFFNCFFDLQGNFRSVS